MLTRRLQNRCLVALWIALLVGSSGTWLSTAVAQRSTTLTVPAYLANGLATGIHVQWGDVLAIEASGRWCMGGRGTDPAVPRGECGGPGGIRWANPVEQPLLLPSAPFGLLLGRISGTTFSIGSSARITAPESGELFLIFNERQGAFGDNSGSVSVTIIVSQAPSGPPSLMAPIAPRETWRVINGYNGGACHYQASICGGNTHDERYAFDLAPDGEDAGGWSVFAPVSGTVRVIDTSDIGTLVKISTSNGYTVHLYHLMNVRNIDGTYVERDDWIGNVWDSYPGTNHLHLHVSDDTGASFPLTIAGRTYDGNRQWNGELIRDNILFSENALDGVPWYFTASIPELSATRFGNRPVWSLQLNEGCSVTLFERAWYEGASRTYTRSTILVEGFGDRVRSVRLSC